MTGTIFLASRRSFRRTRSFCRRWAIVRPPSSSKRNGGPARPGEHPYEFSEAWGNLSIRWARQSRKRQPGSPLPGLIGVDEFPAGYSLVGCSPAAPTSASPAGNDCPPSPAPRNDFSSNRNYPLNSVSHGRGSLQRIGPPYFRLKTTHARAFSRSRRKLH